jgi:serine/threonine protein kinase
MNHLLDKPKSFGPFDLLERVGRGATATVYKAQRRSDGQIVALKLGARMLASDEANFARFKREFTKIRHMRHPHLVEALNFGEEKHVPYIVMEYIEGQNLEQRLQEQGPMPLPEAVAIIMQVAEGLRFMHLKHMLHRDVKPGNILLKDQNFAKLGDFGILKSLAPDSCMTRQGQAMGTIEFGSPEQFEDAKRADFRCDIYSLAATLYAMLTGYFPFGKGGVRRVLQRKKRNLFVPLRLVLPGLPTELCTLIARSIDADRNQRPAHMDEFITALKKIMATQPASEAPNEGDSGGGAERRTAARVSVSLPAEFVPFHSHKRMSLRATIVDVSAGGLCLKTNTAIPLKSIVEVTSPQTGATYIAQVRWIKKQAEQDLLVGCSFACAPNPEEMAAITPTVCQRIAI